MRPTSRGCRSVLSTLSRETPSVRAVARLPTAASSTSQSARALPPVTPALLGVRHKSKKSKASFASNVDEPSTGHGEDDVPVMNTKGKGSAKSNVPRGAKSKRGTPEQMEAEGDDMYGTSTKNDELPNEKYDEKALQANMQRAVERCKQTVTQMVGMHGRADPALLDPVKLAYPGEDQTLYPLRDFASVGTRDGAIVVTLYDKDMLKHVERAIHLANLGLTPQQVGSAEEAVLRLPVPRPTADSRTQLIKDINRVCENARVSIRSARHIGQKNIKKDIDGKIVSASEGQKEQKKMDEEARKWQKEVEDFYSNLKKKIEAERDT